MESILIVGLGLIAQVLYSSRFFIQWFKSEKEGASVSPSLFWKLSLIASAILLIYGVLRLDFSIILGQVLVYYLYIRNLQLKREWKNFPYYLRVIGWIAPMLILFWASLSGIDFKADILHNDDVPKTWMVWGTLGQMIFTLRFYYQWAKSEKVKESRFPIGFWIISLVGSGMILSYAIFRHDIVLLAGHCTGAFVYTRNLLLSLNYKSLFKLGS